MRSPDLTSRIASTGAFEDSPHQRPNHVLLNEVRGRARMVDAKAAADGCWRWDWCAILLQYYPGQGIMVRILHPSAPRRQWEQCDSLFPLTATPGRSRVPPSRRNALSRESHGDALL